MKEAQNTVIDELVAFADRRDKVADGFEKQADRARTEAEGARELARKLGLSPS